MSNDNPNGSLETREVSIASEVMVVITKLRSERDAAVRALRTISRYGLDTTPTCSGTWSPQQFYSYMRDADNNYKAMADRGLKEAGDCSK